MSEAEDAVDLAAIRRQVDDLDTQIVELLVRRTEAARQIGQQAQAAGGALFAPAAEADLLARLTAQTAGRVKPEQLRTVYREILSASREAVRPPRIAFLGPRATFGHQAAIQRFGSSAVYVPTPTNADIVTEVERGNADYGVIPIENSTGGPVEESQDRLVETRLQVCDEVTIHISQCLMSNSPIDEVRTVYSHAQSLAQTRRWVAEHLPGRALQALPSNGLAAERASQEAGAAAIAPRLAAEEYGMNVLAENIQDNPHNYTRFWVVGPHMSERPTGNDKTAIVFSIHDRAGTLRSVASVFADRDISLSSIQSRPARHTGWGSTWDYLFFFELRGHAAEPHVQEALAALEEYTVFVKVLGSWPLETADATA
ncbi:MAG: prephenate dehydratase [Chloroflexi bacterium]|nr:prephenate dehydratase [Chloroflexota bacterium]